jgi:hypothetical protein
MVAAKQSLFRAKTTEGEVFYFVAASWDEAARLARAHCESGEIVGFLYAVKEVLGFVESA